MFTRLIKQIGFLCLGLIIPMVTLAQSFSDVSRFHKNYAAVSALSDLGVINGYNDGSFQPDRTVSRAEAVKLLIASTKPPSFVDNAKNDLRERGYTYANFYDVPVSEWHAPYVMLAQQYGVVGGYPDGSFKPNQSINFAEGLKMIIETYGVDVRRLRFTERPLLYVSHNDWFARYFEYAYDKNLINREKFYHPARAMSRGEFSEILYRLKTIREDGANQFSAQSGYMSDEYTMTIPRLDLIDVSVSFADPYDSQRALAVLKDGIGHYLSPPGAGKKMVLFGHSSGYSWDSSSFKQILRQIDQLKTGDMIYINYKEKGYVYQIKNQEIMPANNLSAVMNDYGYEELALYTCWPPDRTSHRYVVYAAPVI